MRALPSLATFVLVLAVLGAAPRASADPASDQAAAEALFGDARRLVSEGKFAEACPKFAESQRLDPAPGTLVNLGGCYEKAGKTASAWATFKLAVAMSKQKGRADYETIARDHIAALEPKLAMLTINVTRVDGIVIKRDGVALGDAEWGSAIPVDPGPHAIEATAPKKKTWTTTTDVTGDAARVVVNVPALDDDTATGVANPVDTASSRRTIAIGVGAAGLVAIGVGSFFGLRAKSKEDDALTHCRTDTLCSPEGVSLGSDAKSAATVSTILFGVGAAAVAAGVVIYLTAPSATSTSTTSGQRQPALRNLAVRVTPTPNAATISLGGAW